MMLATSFLQAFVLVAMSLGACEAAGLAGTTKIVGNSGVSGQMMFLQSNGQVAILDKVENNPAKRPDGKAPAFAVFYNYNTNTFKTASVRSNTFCAGGGMLGDGRWLVTGGNKAVGTGGVTDKADTSPYFDYSGGKALRFLSPCSGSSCEWVDSHSNQLIKERWYPWVEPMRDGHAMILGGMRNGGFVPSSGSNEASYEFYPNAGGSYSMPVLTSGLPLNLYPITYLLSDNQVFVAVKRTAILWNTDTLKETKLDNVPVTPRNYPAGGGSTMLHMTPSSDYKQTIIFCGGTSLGSAQNWGNEGGPTVMVTQKPAETNCATITPLSSHAWTNTDDLPERRSMGQFINLPDGTLWFGLGATTGAAGYTTDPKSPGKPVGNSFADNPSYQTSIYDPSKPAGQRWRQSSRINVPRLYHSTATLLPDSSILIAGSNPNPDVTTSDKFNTEYRVERWYPDYYDETRPSGDGLPLSIGYGGAGFTLTMNSASDAQNTKVVIMRTGFSTHGWAMGQRSLELRTSVSGNKVQVAAMPANPALFAPGTALAFVVVNGVPSIGRFITVGNGQIGPQPVGKETVLQKSSKRDLEQKTPSNVSVTTQAPSLSDAQRSRADAITNALNGDPVHGTSLPSSLGDMLNGINNTIQQQVQETKNSFNNGTRNAHLSGRRRRQLSY
jgi:hypothetical protein